MYESVIKRIFDLCICTVSMLILCPLFLVIGISIKMTSSGPVLFLQKRIGKDGKSFNIYKFRTMVENAENIGDGLIVKEETDSRITLVGRYLRKTSLDELPQLINILNGTMSLIGPRPPVLYHPYDGYMNYPNWAKKRFKVRPGITGLSQVILRNSATWGERIKIDNTYVDKLSFMLDIKIFFATFAAMLNKEEYTGD